MVLDASSKKQEELLEAFDDQVNRNVARKRQVCPTGLLSLQA